MEKIRKNSGFTLIELSIVLVIIGLIAGGVLGGRELIKQAELRKLLKESDQFKTAVNTFRIKFNCYPGDCPNADQFFGAACGDNTTNRDTGCNGNGDGVVAFIVNMFNVTQDLARGEHLKLWMHLSMAGLIPGSYNGRGTMITYGPESVRGTNVPITYGELGWNAFYHPNSWLPTQQAGVFTSPGVVNAFSVGGRTGLLTGFDTLTEGYMDGGLTPIDAASIDSKGDDGSPVSGKILGTVDVCSRYTTQYIYDTTLSTKVCNLSFFQ